MDAVVESRSAIYDGFPTSRRNADESLGSTCHVNHEQKVGAIAKDLYDAIDA